MSWTANPRNADKLLVLQLILNDDHLSGALGEALGRCRHRLFIATADVKDLHIPVGARRGHFSNHVSGAPSRPSGHSGRRTGSRSILEVFHELSGHGVEIRLLHGGVPSGPFLADLKRGMPATLTMRRCPRVHAKVVSADGRWMYLGSANLTGAGLGAKSERRRNFEAGVWTDDVAVIDPVLDMLEGIWNGARCRACGRKAFCPVPLEEPAL